MQETTDPESVDWLMEFIPKDPALKRLFEYARSKLSTDPSHDLAHALRVALWTLRIAGNQIDQREAIAAGLLHDIVNLPKDSPDRAKASERSAEVALQILPEYGFSQDASDRVANAIRDHSFSRGATPSDILGRALQDADRLEALGAIGMMRCFATGVQLGAQLFDSEDPWAQARERNDKKFSVDHFFVKLLGLPETMQTDEGRQEALRRTRHMRAFLNALGEEIGQPMPLDNEN